MSKETAWVIGGMVALFIAVALMGCNAKTAATDLEVAYAYSIRIDLERIFESCTLSERWDRAISDNYDMDRLEKAKDDLMLVLNENHTQESMEVWFYSTVGLDTINAMAADGCVAAQFLVGKQVDLYEAIWQYDYLEASRLHDAVYPLTIMPDSEPASVDPVSASHPVVSELQNQVARLEACAEKHQPPASADYTALAATIRATLAMASDSPDREETKLLTFKMENANAVLAHC